MSRHIIPAHGSGIAIVVGWDNPLQTFFAEVMHDPAPDDDKDPVILWVGGFPGEAPRPEDLVRPLAPYADLSETLIATLRTDRAARLDHGPSALQRHLLSLFDQSS